jgi:DNA-binding transcriptional MerR regulator
MTIGELAARTGLSVRTLRFYADAGVLPAAGRTTSGHRRYDDDAVARARLVRTLRELGVGLDDVRRVLTGAAALADVAAAHALALDAQIRTLRLQRAVLRAVSLLTDQEELHRMSDLTVLSAAERRRIVDDYLEAVFGGADSPVADTLRAGVPELPEDPPPTRWPRGPSSPRCCATRTTSPPAAGWPSGPWPTARSPTRPSSRSARR